MQTKIILLSGKKQSGKSSSVEAIVRYLEEQRDHVLSTDKCLLSREDLNLLHSFSYKEYSFADPLKEFLISVFGLDPTQCYGTDEQKNILTKVQWVNLPHCVEAVEKLYREARPNQPVDLFNYMSGRELMQIFGSNICRKMYNNCWAESTKKRILKEKPSIAIISDCRFPNELEVFNDLNPIVIRLERNVYSSQHISETALDDYDWGKFSIFYKISNQDMTLEDKNSLVRHLIKAQI